MTDIGIRYFEGNDNYLDLTDNYCKMCNNKDPEKFNVSKGLVFCSECGNCINNSKNEEQQFFITEMEFERKQYIEKHKDIEKTDTDIVKIIFIIILVVVFAVIIELTK